MGVAWITHCTTTLSATRWIFCLKCSSVFLPVLIGGSDRTSACAYPE